MTTTQPRAATRWLPSTKHVVTGIVVVGGIAAAAWYANHEPTAPAPIAAQSSDPPRAQPVRAVTASRQPIQAWVFAEGTARSVRREYLTFERAGRVQVGQEVLLIPGGASATEAFREGNGTSSTASIAAAQQATSIAWQAKGTVFSINPAVNPGGRSVQLKIRSTSGAEYLRDGMFIACWIGVDAKQDAIAAPFDAFLFEESRPYVFVVDAESGASDSGVARRVDVQVGIESLSSREILTGVQAGERLVTDGRYRLVDGAPVKVIDN